MIVVLLIFVMYFVRLLILEFRWQKSGSVKGMIVVREKLNDPVGQGVRELKCWKVVNSGSSKLLVPRTLVRRIFSVFVFLEERKASRYICFGLDGVLMFFLGAIAMYLNWGEREGVEWLVVVLAPLLLAFHHLFLLYLARRRLMRDLA